MLSGDLAFFLLGSAPLTYYLFVGLQTADGGMFQRVGAVTVLAGAMLSLRVDRRTLLGRVHELSAAWKAIGHLLQGVVNTQNTNLTTQRQIGTLIESAGLDSPWGKVSEMRNLELSPSLTALQDIPGASPIWMRYHKFVGTVGTIFLWIGTIAWAFGDILVRWLLNNLI